MSDGSRDFGPFQITWVPAAAPTPLLHCELSVMGALLWAGDFEPTRTTLPFTARLDQYGATGVLTVGWLDPGAAHGQLLGSGCAFDAPTQSLRFDGTIGVW